jgi:hypothetical protein
MKRLLILILVLASLGSFAQQKIVLKVPGTGSGGGSSLPSMTNNAGKVLGTDGSTAAWKQSTPYYYPEDYGAIPNDNIDDAAAFNTMLSAAPARGGVVYIPLGHTYDIQSTVTVTKPMTFKGEGGMDFRNTASLYKSVIKTTASTDLFVVNSDNVTFEGIGFVFSGTATAGAAIKMNQQGDNTHIRGNTFFNFYDCVNFANGGQSIVEGNFFGSWRRYALKLAYETSPDNGDSKCISNWFYGGAQDGSYRSVAAIYQEQGGGWLFGYNKSVAYSEAGKMDYFYKSYFTSHTVDVIITSNSIEGTRLAGIYVEAAPGIFFSNVVIGNNQMATADVDGTPRLAEIYCKNVKGVTIANNHLWDYAISGGTAANTLLPAIVLESVEWGSIGTNTYMGYQDPVKLISCTNVSVLRPSAPYVSTSGSFYLSKSNNVYCYLDGNKTLNPLGLVSGDKATILLEQDGVGGRTVSFPAGSLVNGAINTDPLSKSIVEMTSMGATLFFNIVNGSDTGTTTPPPASTAYQFSGADQSIAVASGGDFAFGYSQPFTIGFRFKVSDGGIVRISTSNDTQEGILVQANGSDPALPGQVQCSFYLANTGSTAYKYHSTIGGSLLGVDTWNKAVFVYDGVGNPNIYINGVLASTGANDVGTLSEIFQAGVLKIGQQQATYHSTGALLDELFILNRALSTLEIAEAYNNGNPIDITAMTFYADVVDGWQFDNSLNSVRGTHNGTATTPQYQ